MAKGGPTYKEVEEIRELKDNGYTYDDIANETGKSTKTVARALKMSNEELEALKESPSPQELQQTAKKKEDAAPSKIRRLSEQRIFENATEEVSNIYTYGIFVKDNIEEMAKEEGFTTIDFILKAVEFYQYNYGNVEKLKNRGDFYRNLLVNVIDEYKSLVYKRNVKNELRDLIMSHSISGKDVPSEIYRSYLSRLGDENG